MTKPVTWSYSSLKLFLLCPHKYYRTRIKKDIVEPESEPMRYGNLAHKAAELYIGEDKPLDAKFEFMAPMLDRLNAMVGEKHCEIKLGLTANLEPTGFFADDVWFRGIIDLLILDGDNARIIDYKTGKSARYADVDQLELMALAIFKHYPQVQRIKAGLLFVVSREFVREEYEQGEAPQRWQKWLRNANRLETATEKQVWNKLPNFTCRGWCPVKDCEHWQPPR